LEDRKQLENENEDLKTTLEKQRREVEDKVEKIEELEEISCKTIELEKDMLSLRPPSITYTFFFKEQRLKHQLGQISKSLPHALDTQK